MAFMTTQTYRNVPCIRLGTYLDQAKLEAQLEGPIIIIGIDMPV